MAFAFDTASMVCAGVGPTKFWIYKPDDTLYPHGGQYKVTNYFNTTNVPTMEVDDFVLVLGTDYIEFLNITAIDELTCSCIGIAQTATASTLGA